MFKIKELVLYSKNNEEYSYKFEAGLNYFKGKNDSGKTVFYNFIDYMFGSSEKINSQTWFSGTIKKAELKLSFINNNYTLSRSLIKDENYFHCSDEDQGDSISLREYKDRLNELFTTDKVSLIEIRNFTGEDLTYRTFTMFNFLGETRQGIIQDFFDKCISVKYAVKLSPMLNYIFNKNLKEIHYIEEELNKLNKEISNLEEMNSHYNFICEQVNNNIEILGLGIWYTGKNIDQVRKKLDEVRNMYDVDQKDELNLADLEFLYSNISEQIKVYENTIKDTKQIEKENKNRIKMLKNLDQLIEKDGTFDYLVEPLKKILLELNNTISFSKYVTSDNTIKALKKERDSLKIMIKRNDSRFKIYSLEEKKKAYVLIEDYLSSDIYECTLKLDKKRKRLRELKDRLRILQETDDSEKIKDLSDYITKLYLSAQGVSSIVNDDDSQNNFRINYIKRGNILQPIIQDKTSDPFDNTQTQYVNYYTGSMARHTLIQLCGYLAFLKMLLSEDKYPLIPILVIDHISKPFDDKNIKALGKVISSAMDDIGKDNLQIFMFDDQEDKALSLSPDKYDDLVRDGKTGFNPFYKINN